MVVGRGRKRRGDNFSKTTAVCRVPCLRSSLTDVNGPSVLKSRLRYLTFQTYVFATCVKPPGNLSTFQSNLFTVRFLASFHAKYQIYKTKLSEILAPKIMT